MAFVPQSLLGEFFDHSTFLRIVEEPQRCRVGAEEIPDGLVVYLHGRELEDELPLRMLVNVAVDLRHAVLRYADHGVRLAAARLPVGENARVDSGEHGEGDLLGPFLVHLPRVALRAEHP